MDAFGTDCARARESVSADLDCELQELDRRRLQAHLRVCAECSAWAEHVTATTLQIREAALEASLAPVLEPTRHRHTWRVGPALAVTPAAAALVAGVVFLFAGAHHEVVGGQPTTSTPVIRTSGGLVQNGAGVDIYMPPTLHRVFQPV